MADELIAVKPEIAAKALVVKAKWQAMTDAADSVHVLGADLHDFVAHQCAGPVWRAMISEALK